MTKILFNKSKKQKLPVSETISKEFIKQLLLRQEGVNLDFKREMYQIHCGNIEGEKRHKGELIKDILSLANRNVGYIGDTSYLVIGVGDQQNEDGNRELFNITDPLPEQKELLQLVNSCSDPQIEDLFCQNVNVDGHNLWVVKIPPTRYLHETTKELWCKTIQGSDSDIPKKKKNGDARYSIRTAFIRGGESIQIATTKERIAIEEAKENFYKQSKSVNLTIFGIILGMLIGSPMGVTNAKLTGTNPTIGFFVGMVIIGIFGAIIGYNTHQVQEIYFSFSSYKTWQQVTFILLTIILFAWLVFIYGRMALGY